MHELSIAMNIVEIVEEHARQENARYVSEVELDIGSNSGVIIEALEFALEEAVRSSIMEKTKLTINKIPSLCKCTSCSHEFEPEDIITPCPECGNPFSDIIKGKEMKIRKIKY